MLVGLELPERFPLDSCWYWRVVVVVVVDVVDEVGSMMSAGLAFMAEALQSLFRMIAPSDLDLSFRRLVVLKLELEGVLNTFEGFGIGSGSGVRSTAEAYLCLRNFSLTFFV